MAELPIFAWRRAANRLTRQTVGALGRGASVALARVEPVLSPWLSRTTSRLVGRAQATPVGAVRVTLEQYVRRTIHAFEPVVEQPTAVTPAVDPGVLLLTRSVEQKLSQLERYRRFERCADPIEAVHQLRVATRRLRAFVDMFGPLTSPGLSDVAKKPLRRITRSVRDLRDADVQSAHLQQRVIRASSEPERVALYHLLQRTRVRRNQLAERACKELRKVDLAPSVVALRSMLDELARRAQSPSANYQLLAELAYEPILSRARELRPRGRAQVTPAALHEFRLALKQLRYAAELIEPAMGEHFAEVHTRAKRLQNLLGDHQDAVQFEQMVTRRLRKVSRGGREVLSGGLSIVQQQAIDERERTRQQCLERLGELGGKRLFSAPCSVNAS